MAIFNSYVKLPEGIHQHTCLHSDSPSSRYPTLTRQLVAPSDSFALPTPDKDCASTTFWRVFFHDFGSSEAWTDCFRIIGSDVSRIDDVAICCTESRRPGCNKQLLPPKANQNHFQQVGSVAPRMTPNLMAANAYGKNDSQLLVSEVIHSRANLPGAYVYIYLYTYNIAYQIVSFWSRQIILYTLYFK